MILIPTHLLCDQDLPFASGPKGAIPLPQLRELEANSGTRLSYHSCGFPVPISFFTGVSFLLAMVNPVVSLPGSGSGTNQKAITEPHGGFSQSDYLKWGTHPKCRWHFPGCFACLPPLPAKVTSSTAHQSTDSDPASSSFQDRLRTSLSLGTLQVFSIKLRCPASWTEQLPASQSLSL